MAVAYVFMIDKSIIMELSMDIGHRPLIILRFNPDSYINRNGVNISSCWRCGKHGINSVAKTKKREWDSRLHVLVTQLEYWISNPTDKTVEVIQLYYDGFDV
jgi:hypothetical protein